MAKPAFDLTQLTPEEKLELIDELWTSIRPDELPLTDEQHAELQRRLERLDAEAPSGVSWDSVRGEMIGDDRDEARCFIAPGAIHRKANAL